jgi:hypothetical protein
MLDWLTPSVRTCRAHWRPQGEFNHQETNEGRTKSGVHANSSVQSSCSSGSGICLRLREGCAGASATSLVQGATATAAGTAEPPRYFQSLSQRMFSQVMLPCTPLTPCGTVAGMNSTSPALIVCDCPPTIFPF